PLSNSCGKPAGLPLTVRVLQVTDASALGGLTLDRLWDHEDKVLGTALLAKNDLVVDPGTRKELLVERAALAKSAVVVGSFCKTEGSCWLVVKNLKGKGATIKLAADASCLRDLKH